MEMTMHDTVRTDADPSSGHAEDASLLRERHFVQAIDGMPQPFGIYSAERDASGRVVDFRIAYLNAPASAFFGARPGSVLGQLLSVCDTAYLRLGLSEAFAEVVDTGRPLRKQGLAFAGERGGRRRVRYLDLEAWKRGEGVAVMWRDVSSQRRARAAQRAGEEQFRLLAESLPGMVCVLRRSGASSYVNAQWEAYAGMAVAETHAASILGAVHPDDVDGLKARFRVARNNAERFDLELRVRRASDGEYRWFLCQCAPRVSDHGRVLRWICSAVDIQEMKDAERALRRYAALLEQTYDAVFVREFPNKAIVYWNKASEQLFGYGRAEALGRLSHELLGTEHINGCPCRDRPVGADGVWTGEIVHQGRDGRQIVCEARHVLLTEPDGRRYMLVSNRDITRRRRAEAAMRESEERFRALRRSRIIGVVLGREQRIVDANDAFLQPLGYTRAELETGELTWACLTSRNDSSRIDAALREVVAQGSCTPFEEELVGPDGRRIPLLVSASMLHQDPLEWVGIALDLTERKRLERHLEDAHKMDAMGRMAGGLAHEFNNLLAIILGYADLAADDLPPDSSVQPYLARIRDASDRAATLVLHLLEFARRERREPQLIDVNDVVRGLSTMLRPLLGEDVQLLLLPNATESVILLDPHQLHHVLLNLATNARDAMSRGGKLVIWTETVRVDGRAAAEFPSIDPGSYVCIGVQDSGTGMTDTVQARAFEPFFTTKPVGQATGLGLSICYGIVTQNHGHIGLESCVDTGTTVRVLFPLAPAPMVSLDAPGASLDRELCGDETVLVVEDEDAVRELMVRSLADHGYTALAAPDGVEGLQVAETHGAGIDLALADIVMPRMGGPDLVRILRATIPDIRVLYTTGYAREALVEFDGELAEATVLQKPFGRRALLVAVREALEAGVAPTE
jgi:PAS domain S-box-containing protein